MDKKDEFIVSVLSSLGLGVNAMIPKNAEMFASRMKQTINGINVGVGSVSDDGLTLIINNSFSLEYKKEGSRVVSVEVKC